jgi:hypothetical protein
MQNQAAALAENIKKFYYLLVFKYVKFIISFDIINMPIRLSPYMRATNLSTLGPHVPVLTRPLNNCNNTLCYTYNHNYIYQPHTAYGRVGTTAAGYLASRKRL